RRAEASVVVTRGRNASDVALAGALPGLELGDGIELEAAPRVGADRAGDDVPVTLGDERDAIERLDGLQHGIGLDANEGLAIEELARIAGAGIECVDRAELGGASLARHLVDRRVGVARDRLEEGARLACAHTLTTLRNLCDIVAPALRSYSQDCSENFAS